MRKLLIVESPSKIKSIKKYLGSDFDVMASMGHVRDLPKSKLGIDVDKGFKLNYTNMPDKKDVLKNLKMQWLIMMQFISQPTLIERVKLLLGIWLKFWALICQIKTV